MHTKSTVAAVVLAGGSGTRFGGSTNKVYLPLGGQPVIYYSLRAMDSHPEIDEIIIVIKEGEESLLGEPDLKKPYKVVYGGSTRRESVFNGISATNADIVVIQDGARPFLKEYYVSDCLTALEDYPGAAVAIRAKDTVKIAYENQLVMRTPNRNNTWQVQTPQCFRRADLLSCYERYDGFEATDDCMMLEHFNKPVLLVSGDDINIKITTKSDLGYAEYILNEREYI